MSSSLHYLAYGSNLLPSRLRARTPSARVVGVAPIPGYRLAFHKIGMDGSGKCDLVATGRAVDRAWGAVYHISRSDRELLTGIEGPDYRLDEISVNLPSDTLMCFCYFALEHRTDASLRPFAWYRDLVLGGARHHGLPDSYVDCIARLASTTDPDSERSRAHRTLLHQ